MTRSRHNAVILRRGTLLSNTTYLQEEIDECLDCGSPENLDEWWVVTWPEHVYNPSFNSDANYRGPYDSLSDVKKEFPNAIVHVDDRHEDLD